MLTRFRILTLYALVCQLTSCGASTSSTQPIRSEDIAEPALIPSGSEVSTSKQAISERNMAELALNTVATYTCENLSNDPRPKVYFSSSTTVASKNQIGTLSKPYSTLAKLSTVNLTNGAILCLKRGDIFTDSLVLADLGDRTEASRIDVTIYGSGSSVATIQPAAATATPTSNNSLTINGYAVGVEIINSGNITVQSIKVNGLGRRGVGFFAHVTDAYTSLPPNKQPQAVSGFPGKYYSNINFLRVEASNFITATVSERWNNQLYQYQ